MAFDSDEKKTVVDVIKVNRHEGTSIDLPKNIPLPRVIKALQVQMAYEETEVGITGEIPGFPNEGAFALYNVLKEDYGFVSAVSTPGFFGSTPPILRTIEVGLGQYVQVPWGRMQLPHFDRDEWINASTVPSGNQDRNAEPSRYVFQISAMVKRKHEDEVQRIVQRTRERVLKSPLYGGQAFSVRLTDEHGNILENPEPKFLPINSQILDQLVFNDDVMANININLFTPIRHADLVRAIGGQMKRGILLSGTWGTGKSMTSAAAAYLATQNKQTFVLCERADELADVMRLASDYGRAVVFCEDIDQVMSGDRDISMNDILNVIDGVESKSSELLVVLTTNNVMKIEQAMLRPGRLDKVINVTVPNAKSVERLIRLYGGDQLPADLDVTDIAEAMDGNIPAVIREMVESARYAAIHRNPVAGDITILHEDLTAAALSMQNQLDLLKERAPDLRSPIEKGADIIAAALAGGDVLSNGATVN